MIERLLWGAPDWIWPALLLGLLAAWMAARSYRDWFGGWRLRAALAMKLVAIAALAVALCQPLWHSQRPKTGANELWLVADNSASLRIKDQGERQSRGEKIRAELVESRPWRTRVEQDFVVRRFIYDARIQPVSDFEGLKFDGTGSRLIAALESLARRTTARPCAGILLFTDGTSTDSLETAIQLDSLPPIFPVVTGDRVARDLALTQVHVAQSNFEAAPVMLACQVQVRGVAEDIVVQLLDDAGRELEQTTVTLDDSGLPPTVRFRFRPDQPGLAFFQLRTFARSDLRRLDSPETVSEATLENNSQWVVVDRGGGPYRVLYVGGRPNWEFKFLNRAIEEDDEVQLVGLLRIAKREPKFEFRSRAGEQTNPLYRGFDPEDEEAQRYDQPVLLRLGTRDDKELAGGFPTTAEQLFAYDALLLDDIEAEFFTTDQQLLVREFVSRRGGTVAMLAGPDTFGYGKYHDSPIGDTLPIYMNSRETADVQGPFHLELTREGWLQPWVRLRDTEAEETTRLQKLAPLKTIIPITNIKPGAIVLAEITDAMGTRFPMLVTQQFGRGRAAALLGADLWRWQLRASENAREDLEILWRQIVRWMVADVPPRLAVNHHKEGDTVVLEIEVRGRDFHPVAGSDVTLTIVQPDGTQRRLTAEPSGDLAGKYVARFTPSQTGPYRATVKAQLLGEEDPLERQVGWAASPVADEFARIEPNRALLEELAQRSGGQLVELDKLDEWIEDLPSDRVPIVEAWDAPLWHHWGWLALVVGSLCVEWGLRRWNGLP